MSKGLIVYGRTSCGMCIHLKAQLDYYQLEYTSRDVDEDEDANAEMWGKVRIAPW